MSQFVEVVLSLIADTFLKFGQSENGFSSVGTALLPAMYFSVQSPKFLLGLPVPARILNLFARRKSDEAVQPNVQTDFVGVIRQGLGGDLAGKNGIPLPSPALDADALDSSFQWTMPTNGNATNARYLQSPTVDTKAVAILFQTKRAKALPGLESWVAGLFPCFYATEEGVEGLLQVLNDSLKNMRVDISGIRIIGLRHLDLPALLDKTNGFTGLFVGKFSFFQAFVVEMPARFQGFAQSAFLRSGGVQPVSKGLEHSDAFLGLDIPLDNLA